MNDKSVDTDFATTAFSCDHFVASFVTILESALDVFLDFAPLLVKIIGMNSAPSTFSILSLYACSFPSSALISACLGLVCACVSAWALRTFTSKCVFWKFLMNPDGGRKELYNLSTDPSETSNVADGHAAEVARLGELLLEWKQSVPD